MSFTTNRKQALPFSQWMLPIFFLLEKPPSEQVGFTQAPWFPASLSFPLSCLWSGSTIIAAPASGLLPALFWNELWWGPDSPNYLEGNYTSSPLKSLLSLSRRFIAGRLLLISLSLWRLKFRYKYSFWELGMGEGDREIKKKQRERKIFYEGERLGQLSQTEKCAWVLSMLWTSLRWERGTQFFNSLCLNGLHSHTRWHQCHCLQK